VQSKLHCRFFRGIRIASELQMPKRSVSSSMQSRRHYNSGTPFNQTQPFELQCVTCFLPPPPSHPAGPVFSTLPCTHIAPSYAFCALLPPLVLSCTHSLLLSTHTAPAIVAHFTCRTLLFFHTPLLSPKPLFFHTTVFPHYCSSIHHFFPPNYCSSTPLFLHTTVLPYTTSFSQTTVLPHHCFSTLLFFHTPLLSPKLLFFHTPLLSPKPLFFHTTSYSTPVFFHTTVLLHCSAGQHPCCHTTPTVVREHLLFCLPLP